MFMETPRSATVPVTVRYLATVVLTRWMRRRVRERIRRRTALSPLIPPEECAATWTHSGN